MNVHIGAAYHPGFIRPGRPVENDYIESLNGRFRDECLNDHWFLLLRRARATIQAWRDEYNGQDRTAAWAGSRRREFAAAHQDTMTDPGGGAAQPDTQRLAADSNFKPD
ncbi:transposase [Cupriavidus sp. SIMBA_020]|uniref:integrase core domain-containing protein n=1 Tax=Cupriavidus sp. SIMBA_020 TaxID=3085766 RepID=UPI003979D2B3